MGKGSKRRPRSVSSEEETLRWELLNVNATKEQKDEIRRRLVEIRKQSTTKVEL